MSTEVHQQLLNQISLFRRGENSTINNLSHNFSQRQHQQQSQQTRPFVLKNLIKNQDNSIITQQQATKRTFRSASTNQSQNNIQNSQIISQQNHKNTPQNGNNNNNQNESIILQQNNYHNTIQQSRENYQFKKRQQIYEEQLEILKQQLQTLQQAKQKDEIIIAKQNRTISEQAQQITKLNFQNLKLKQHFKYSNQKSENQKELSLFQSEKTEKTENNDIMVNSQGSYPLKQQKQQIQKSILRQNNNSNIINQNCKKVIFNRSKTINNNNKNSQAQQQFSSDNKNHNKTQLSIFSQQSQKNQNSQLKQQRIQNFKNITLKNQIENSTNISQISSDESISQHNSDYPKIQSDIGLIEQVERPTLNLKKAQSSTNCNHSEGCQSDDDQMEEFRHLRAYKINKLKLQTIQKSIFKKYGDEKTPESIFKSCDFRMEGNY